MKIGYVSDLHLEFRAPHPFIHEPAEPGDVLIVAGDLTTANILRPSRSDSDGRKHRKLFEKFLTNVTSKYKQVLWIMGNHEHYGHPFPRTQKTLQQSLDEIYDSEQHNIDVVEKGAIEFPSEDVIILCTTLWTDFLGRNPVSMGAVSVGMNDYRIIGRTEPDENGKVYALTVEDTLAEFDHSVLFLRENAQKFADKKIVVATHHGPTYKSLHPDHTGNGLDGGYCSDLSNFILDRPQIKYWIHGHTHKSVDYLVGDTRILANQCGYYVEQSFRDFKGIEQFEL